VVERHEPGEHVFKTGILQAAGDIEEEVELGKRERWLLVATCG
jgi:hypothetical protein